MRRYEVVVIIGPQVADDEVENTFDRLIKLPIESKGGEVEEIDLWGRRKLAYPISKQVEGSYVISQLKMEPAMIKELEQGLKISEDVLRHLFVRLDDEES